ncbi:MAG TPA: mechanosensitive ion channel family protein [Marinagarivorans sp.]
MDFSRFASHLSSIELHLPPYVTIALIVIASYTITLLLKRYILARISQLIARTHFTFDTLLIDSLKTPLSLLVLICNLLLLNNLLIHFDYSTPRLSTLINQSLIVLFIGAIVIFINNFCAGTIGAYAKKSPALYNSQAILQGVTRALILSIGALVLLGTLGISVTPIIASLGITSLAVALALQPTLENFFSGVQLVIDKPVRVGDFIELDSGEQGFVDKIGWRSTWIKMLPNNTVIIPNSVLSNAKVINYFYPEKELSVPVDIGVHYDSDLEHVEQVTLEVAREVLNNHKWGVGSYDTFVVFHTFDDSSINFTVMLRAKEYFNRFFIKSAFIKAIHKRYAQEGIVIPYPIRAINTAQESASIPDSSASPRPMQAAAPQK